MLESGTILQQRYVIINKIASGGMADVYQANDNFLNRVVAIKILNSQATSDSQIIKKFYKEVEATTRIRHENIVEVYDVFEQDNKWCIVLELIVGYTLKDRLLRIGPLSLTECLEIFKSILLAVQVAHQEKIIHRDLKPENILISFDGKVKVSDFGIAIMIDDEKTISNKIIGTAKYISPEAVQSLPLDIRSDIYSLGIMFFELLTGSTPFNGKNPTLVAVKQVREPLPSAKLINPCINQALENIIVKATARNVNERYQTITELLNDLFKLQQIKDKKIKPLKLKNSLSLKRGQKMQQLVIKNRLKMGSLLLQKTTIISLAIFSSVIFCIFCVFFLLGVIWLG